MPSLPRYVSLSLILLGFLGIAAAVILAGLASGGRLFPLHRPALALSAGVPLRAAIAAAPNASSPPPAIPTPTMTPTPLPTATPTPVPPKPGAVTHVPILMYHYIRELPPTTPDRLGYGLSVSPRLFEQQLSYLAGAGYHIVSMAQLAGHMTRGTPLPANPIVLTFDDGYADFYSAALPLLQQYHFSATTYLVVDFLNRPGYMTWQQAAQLRDLGFEIGAHTLHHVDLAVVPASTAHAQIDQSRRILRQRLNAPVETFAYPSGRFNAAVLREVARSGFTSAVTTNFGDRYTVGQLLTLPRVRVPGGISTPNFIKNLSA
ncbi:MAG: polysaccharide deacetylase family protein [Chloroflexota bacterium]|nr:polysaccharide deacetylase family protein [Chloroflexota bacterium]